MALTVHPRLFNTRGMLEDRTPAGEQIRVLVYAPSRAAWIEGELAHKQVLLQLGHSVAQVVSALTEDPPPRPQILVADFDDVSPVEVLHLHVLREQGWFGRIIALGNVPGELRSSLGVDCVFSGQPPRGALRDAVTDTNFVAATTRMPVL